MSFVYTIEPKGAPTLTTNAPTGIMPASSPLAAQAAATPAADKSFPLDALLQTGVQVAATIGGIRAQTGATASRQQRIAACGRKPLFGRAKKDAYRKCVADLNSGGGNRSYVPPPPAPARSNTMTIVLVGLGILAIGGLTIFLLRRK